MSDSPEFNSPGQESGPGVPAGIGPDSGKFPRARALLRDRRFRIAWGVSVFLHAVIFAAAAWTPSSAKYRFYGSGTAVSLVGADEIPGGSARGKSGDRPESVKKSKAAGAKKARKITVKKKKKKAKTKSRKKRVRKKKKKNVRKLAVKKKKKISKKRLAKLKAIKVRRERLKKWKKKYGKVKKKKPAPVPKKKAAAPKKKPGGGNDLRAKNVPEAPPKPRAGFPGEGGGDGQGGGSLGGGSGGVARTEIERYYGLLGERVRNFWTIPPNLSDIEHLKTVVIFDVGRDGTIRDLRIEKPSGNRVYDNARPARGGAGGNPFFAASAEHDE